MTSLELQTAYELLRKQADKMPATLSAFVDGQVIINTNVQKLDLLDQADEALLDWIEQDADKAADYQLEIRTRLFDIDDRTKRRLKIQARYQLQEHIVISTL